MKSVNYFQKAVLLPLLSSFLLLSGSNLSVHAQDSLKSSLFEQVEAALKLENEIVVLGNSENAIAKNPKAKRLLKYFQKRIAKSQKISRARSTVSGPKYRDGTVKLKLTGFTLNQNTAIVAVEERKVNHFDAASIAAGAPGQTEELIEHKFTFVFSNGSWELLSSSNNDPTSLENEKPTPVAAQNIPSLLTVQPSDPLSPPSEVREEDNVQTAMNDSNFSLSRGVKVASLSLDGILIAQSTRSLNRQAIVDYATRYAINPNSAYKNFASSGGDCTNFVSQSMRAGGWTDVFKTNNDAVTENRKDSSLWFQNSVGQSYTWTGAPNFFQFIQNRNRVISMSRSSDLLPGDLISVDFGGDDSIEHTMVVTKKDSFGIYVSYHTSNTLNKPFADFVRQSSANSKYYAWRVYNTFN
jgi:Putative amidase domain